MKALGEQTKVFQPVVSNDQELLMPENLEPSSLVQLLSTDYKFAVSFVILLIVLLFKPTGLFKGQAV